MANKDIEKAIAETEDTVNSDVPAEPEYAPIYQVYPNSKIPVSKSVGPFWGRRFKEGKAFLKQSRMQDRWEEAIRYYQNDQGARSDPKRRLDEVGTGSSNESKYTTENIVFANVSALVPVVYAKNPDVEITTGINAFEAKATMHEALVDTLFRRKVSPGINLKPKMRRLVVMAMLTNIGYLEVSYTKKEDSSDAVIEEVMTLSEQLQNAKTTKEVAEIEGKLQALDEKVSLLSAAGPKVRVRAPQDVIVDPNSVEPDLSDASYIMVRDYIRTEMMRAIYGRKGSDGQWLSLFDPTHVISGSTNRDINGHDNEINSFSLIGDQKDYTKFGYNTEEDYRDACRTEVWYVWDKATRRVLMFNDKDWSMPVWVWDDPYHLTRFFPLLSLSFYADPVDRYGRSEVMYYLDQQDELNTMNNELARMRHWVLSKVFVNTTVLKDPSVVQNFLSGKAKYSVQGIQLPEGVKIGDAIGTLPTPSTQFAQMFDSQRILQSINRISSVTPILQNEQFKTNTTNKAIESYESSTQTRLDEKIDAIEELLADLGVMLIEMCIQFMSEDEVKQLIGDELVTKAGGWDVDMTPDVFHKEYEFQIVGGSTLKPTSKVKKEQAIQLGQVLGQFAAATPAVVVLSLKMIQRAFQDDFVITKEEWDMLMQSVQQAAMQPARSPNGGGRPPEAGGQQPPQPNAGGDPVNAALDAFAQIIDGAPPEVKNKVGDLIAQGVPLKQIMQQLAQ